MLMLSSSLLSLIDEPPVLVVVLLFGLVVYFVLLEFLVPLPCIPELPYLRDEEVEREDLRDEEFVILKM